MLLTSEERSVAALDAVYERFRQRLPAPQAATAEALARQFFQRVPPDELNARDPEQLCGMLHSLLRFMRQRLPGQPLVRVFNPRPDQHGWESSHTVVEIVNDDMPFLVDSVSMAVFEQSISIHLIIHPLVRLERDSGGYVLELVDEDEAGDRGRYESVMHFEIDRQTEPDVLRRLRERIEEALRDVRAAVTDWKPMAHRALEIARELPERPEPVPEERVTEARELLEWLADDHFTFLGYREYEIVDQDGEPVLQSLPDTGLGILAASHHRSRARRLRNLSRTAREIENDPEVLILTKTNARATVHRPSYMDYVGVLRYDEHGRVVGEQRFLGLFTSSAYNRRPWEIPYVRGKVQQVLQHSAVRPESHAGKALMHILETLPRDELFQATVDELYDLAMGILHLQERRRTRLFIRRDHFGRFFSCLVFIPRDRFNTALRERIQSILKRHLKGERVDFTVQVAESVLARLHVVVRPKAGTEVEFDVRQIEERIVHAVRSWQDELRDILIEKHGEERGLKLANRYGQAMPAAYVEDVTPWIAAFDVEHVASLRDQNDIRMSLYRPRRRRVGLFRFKIFKFARTMPLSDVLPMLENMGLRIVSERPYELSLADGSSVWIQDFDMIPVHGDHFDLDTIKEPFQQCFYEVWSGRAENDGFNRLVLAARLDWRQVSMLRAYCKFLLQTGVPFSQAYMERTLAAHPVIARVLVELFEARFDPARGGGAAGGKGGDPGARALRRTLDALARVEDLSYDSAITEALVDARSDTRDAQIGACRNALRSLLDSVSGLDEDRILRGFVQVIAATVRTNYFQTDVDGNPPEHLALKFRSQLLPDLPEPRPMFELFVYSPRVEAIHLRGGLVARGGLRWSDRREDFRTEVLSLMKAQNVKNTMIVPVGAKGGFVVKQPPGDDNRDSLMAEVVACYRSFIHGMLDVTDNLDEDRVVHPRQVVRHDGDDPYLVVAADKGTATFSDIANAVAEEHGHWLGDAFASGGSVGYDHKAMAITARGAWECVKRHFRDMGMDCESEPITVVGVGDMSGDVFGNGMLMSRHIKLIAAFNHKHIFIDPDPDPATSYVERERLFRLPRSQWTDYDPELISAGGGVFSRDAKRIRLTAEIKTLLGLRNDELSAQELVRAILTAPADLFWNGGIGTYVKASDERHADVGDRANNAVRVNGAELRCRVVGEGGNLGLSQRGRIEYALSGGRINTDFIDNSGGVDCSDHEVNIKILLNAVRRDGRIDAAERKRLLEAMSDEVAELVLRNNYLQSQAISMMEAFSATRIGAKAHYIRVLENAQVLDRTVEYLPSEETIQERRARGQGMTRPELAVLLSYSKIQLYGELLSSDIPEDPYLSRELYRYFPERLQEGMLQYMDGHRLRREIIATQVTNSMVNRMGATFAARIQEDTGASASQVARAYTIAREVFDARTVWSGIESLDTLVPSSLQIEMMLKVWNLLRHATRWLLNRPVRRLDVAEAVERFRDGVVELRALLPQIVATSVREELDEERERLIELGVPEPLAASLGAIPAMYPLLDIVDVASSHDLPVERVGAVYYRLGEVLKLGWLGRRVDRLPVDGQWHAHARGALRDELYSQHRALTARILSDPEVGGREQPVDAWMQHHSDEVEHVQYMLADMETTTNMDYATLLVAIRGVEQLVAVTAEP